MSVPDARPRRKNPARRKRVTFAVASEKYQEANPARLANFNRYACHCRQPRLFEARTTEPARRALPTFRKGNKLAA